MEKETEEEQRHRRWKGTLIDLASLFKANLLLTLKAGALNPGAYWINYHTLDVAFTLRGHPLAQLLVILNCILACRGIVSAENESYIFPAHGHRSVPKATPSSLLGRGLC